MDVLAIRALSFVAQEQEQRRGHDGGWAREQAPRARPTSRSPRARSAPGASVVYGEVRVIERTARPPRFLRPERPQLNTPSYAAPVLAQYIGEQDRETFAVAMLTVRQRLIGLHTVSVGCLTSAREVFKPAILAACAALVLATRPSGLLG